MRVRSRFREFGLVFFRHSGVVSSASSLPSLSWRGDCGIRLQNGKDPEWDFEKP